MVQSNELRIGNWLIKDDDGLPERVSIIYPTRVKFLGFDHATGLEGVSPIPLTPEWLTRAGFVKEFDDVYSIGLPTGDGVDLLLEWGDCCLRRNHVGKEKKEGDKNPYDYAYIKAPKYVHQLQQLYFSLSGQELEFK